MVVAELRDIHLPAVPSTDTEESVFITSTFGRMPPKRRVAPQSSSSDELSSTAEPGFRNQGSLEADSEDSNEPCALKRCQGPKGCICPDKRKSPTKFAILPNIRSKKASQQKSNAAAGRAAKARARMRAKAAAAAKSSSESSSSEEGTWCHEKKNRKNIESSSFLFAAYSSILSSSLRVALPFQQSFVTT